MDQIDRRDEDTGSIERSEADIERDRNRDPLTGASGAHPVGTGIGALAGGIATGAAVGTAAGPVGTAIGAAVGAVVGGLAGKGAAELIDPTVEDAYWRENHAERPYYTSEFSYDDDYAPAYRYGYDAYLRHRGRPFPDAEADLARDWPNEKGGSRLDWERARHATRDSWDRMGEIVERALPGDADRDGR